ncbi:DUF2845 domain-containing protein [Sandaracinus amylolyticus]|uniref:DUF2845 domain-containing protein n=1 Tax=Sandaracinus amylolyticus TaxID=927083 RepID=UPI001F26BA76|nr:DUF2845 domain-containing protein [Sandaracinus amylolyticus]UJR79515.1 Hypothetical protein I5071_15510 [Sandaracinus amylolyticus]
MARWLSLLALVASPFLFDGTAHALRCGTRLVVTGDPIHYVRSICGDPASITTSTVSRTRTVGSRIVAGTVIADSVTVTVAIETWVYDFGPRRFMEELTFEDGTLVRQRPLSYGTRTAIDPPARRHERVAILERRRALV